MIRPKQMKRTRETHPYVSNACISYERHHQGNSRST